MMLNSYRLGAAQNVSVTAAGTTAAFSTVFGTQTRQIMCTYTSTNAAAVSIGARVNIATTSTSATSSSTLVPPNWQYVFTVTPGQAISAISNDASIGTLSVTEIT